MRKLLSRRISASAFLSAAALLLADPAFAEFSGPAPGSNLSTFTTPGSTTFAFPAAAVQVCYLVQGASSSGANGHAQASGTATSGGGGGSAGGLLPPGGGFKCVPASTLASPVTVVVGAGGAAPTGDGTAGNIGTQSCFGVDCAFGGGAPSGGATSTASASGASGHVRAAGASASGASAGAVFATGYNIAGSSGAAGTGLATGGAGGGGTASGSAGTAGGVSITGATGAGSGAGIAAVQVGLVGGNAGARVSLTPALAGQPGVSNGDAATVTCLHDGPGSGGGGGASNVVSRGGNGAGGCDGGGGGGGGSTGNGQTPGIGGKGGDGIVLAYWR